MKAFISLVLALSACGVDVAHEVGGSARVDLGFERADKFCSEKYGAGTEAAEQCFLDYRQFGTIRVKIDFDSIMEFCRSTYIDEAQVDACRDDLLDILKDIAQMPPGV